MDHRKFGQTYLVRMERGEEIQEQLQALCEKEGIRLAHVSALGAVSEFTIGVFHPAEKRYAANTFQGDYEITALTGTVTTKDGAYYAHLHMTAGDETGHAFGGHLNRAVISATCEMVVTVLDGTVERAFDEGVGLNLFRFL